MANRSKLVGIALPLVAAAASLAAVLLLLCSTGSPEDGYLGRVGMPWGAGTVTVLPFSPTDVLPLLPRGVAMAALRALRGVSDIFPVFVGAASAGGPGSAPGSVGTVRWKGACFYENEAWLVFHNESGSKYGGGTLHIKVRTPFPQNLARFCNSTSNSVLYYRCANVCVIARCLCCRTNDQLPKCDIRSLANCDEIEMDAEGGPESDTDTAAT